MIDTDIYKLVNGTSYDKRTDDEVIRILEHCRMNDIRVVLDYGDTKTGNSWNERYDITGRVGRSSGQIKIPILLHNKRSNGGGAMLTHCIIGIKRSKGKDTLYKWKADKCKECGITKDELPELQTLESCLCWECYFETEEMIE